MLSVYFACIYNVCIDLTGRKFEIAVSNSWLVKAHKGIFDIDANLLEYRKHTLNSRHEIRTLNFVFPIT